MTNWFDIVTIFLLIFALIKGYKKGLIMQITGMFTIILSAVFGGRVAKVILPQLQNYFQTLPSNIGTVISYAIAFVCIGLVISLIAKLVHKLFNAANLSFVNRLLGSIISLSTTMIVLSLIINLVQMIDFKEDIIKPNIKKESFFYKPVQSIIPAIVPYLNKEALVKLAPKNYRKTDEKNITLPTKIDSVFQQKYFGTDSVKKDN